MNPADLYVKPLQAVINLVLAIAGVDYSELENLDCELKSDNKTITDKLIREILIKLTTLLQNKRCMYMTKVVMTACFPIQLLNVFAAYSAHKKLNFHVELNIQN